MLKFYLVFYYAFVQFLPNSKYFNIISRFRAWYVHKYLLNVPLTSQAVVENNVYLSDAKNLSIGPGCQINENVFIQGAQIGNNVLIAPGVSILSTTHYFKDKEKLIINQGDTPVNMPVIGNDVWVGRNAIIMPGVRIGVGAVVGAGAVVTRNVNNYDVVGGVPAKKISTRE